MQQGDILQDRYVVERHLGGDGFVQVYRARNQRLGFPVFVRLFLRADERGARLERAAGLMARIRHANVVPILDYWADDRDRPVLVTEYTAGETLRSYIDRRGAIPWKAASWVFLDVLKGLAAIHAGEVVHRNVSADNVLLVSGSEQLAKITGLGFAKSLRGGDNVFKITRHAEPVGAPAYISPEQLTCKPLDQTADLYSAGIVFYEMLAGAIPEERPTLQALLRRAERAPAPPIPPPECPQLPSKLAALFVEALDPNPDKRPASAALFARRLAAAVADAGVELPLGELAPAAPAPPVAAPTPAPRPATRPAPATRAPSERAARPTPKPLADAPSVHKRPTAASLVTPDPGETAGATTPVRMRRATPPKARPAAKAGASEARQSSGRKPHALIAVRLSPHVLRDASVSEWLALVVGTTRQAFVVGQNAWVAVIDARDDEAAMAEVRQVRNRIKERFGDDTPVASRRVGGGFVLPAACVTGRAAPPVEVMGLLDVLSRVGR